MNELFPEIGYKPLKLDFRAYRGKAPSPPKYKKPEPEKALLPTKQETSRNKTLFGLRNQLEGNLNTLSPEFQQGVDNALQAQYDEASNQLGRTYDDTVRSQRERDFSRFGGIQSSIAMDNRNQIDQNYTDALQSLAWNKAQGRPAAEAEALERQLLPLEYLSPQMQYFDQKTGNAYNFGRGLASDLNNYNQQNYTNQLGLFNQNQASGAANKSALIGGGATLAGIAGSTAAVLL